MLYICGSKKTKQNKHKNKKYRELEAVPLNAEIKALVNDLDSLQQRPKDFEDEEIMPIALQKDTDGIKADHALASSITRDDDKVATETPTQGVEHQQLRVKFGEGLKSASPSSTIISRSSWDLLRKIKLETFQRDRVF